MKNSWPNFIPAPLGWSPTTNHSSSGHLSLNHPKKVTFTRRIARYPPKKTNDWQWKQNHLKIYLLLKNGTWFFHWSFVSLFGGASLKKSDLKDTFGFKKDGWLDDFRPDDPIIVGSKVWGGTGPGTWWVYIHVYLGTTPHPVAVTTRTYIFSRESIL